MKVLVFPRDKNPYQEQLYNEMPSSIEISYIETKTHNRILALLSYSIQLIQYRFRGYKVLHLHWLYSFALQSPNNLIDKLLKILVLNYIFKFLLLSKILGYKIVWTVHNVVPHEPLTINDVLLTKLIVFFSNTTIILSKDTLSQLHGMGVKATHIRIIPLGNYIGLYPNTISPDVAREELQIPKDNFVYLFFGLIRKYKGIELLLQAFEKMAKSNSKCTLIIAGECNDGDIRKVIESYQQRLSDRLLVRLKHIPDVDVQKYFNAANISVFPFKKVTNSSSVLLSFSFGKPSIYPRLGNLSEFPKDVGLGFEANNLEDLQNNLEMAFENKNEILKLEKKSLEYAQTFSWKKIATDTAAIYLGLE